MANIKSAEKRILVAERNRQRNKTALSLLRTSVKKFRAAVEAGDKDVAQALLRQAHATIDKSAKKGVIHDRTASRYKSRLALAAGRLASAP
jgi:small subunit ribosomal protein S20